MKEKETTKKMQRKEVMRERDEGKWEANTCSRMGLGNEGY